MKPFRTQPIRLSEAMVIGPNEISDDVQIIRVGTFFHEGQIIDVTKSHLKTIIKNHEKNVRGIDLMLDYSHESEGEAAAWFENLYLSEDGKELWAKVEWTEDGADAVRKRKYRYISADLNFAYKDNETLKDHGAVLLGAGLTNRPVIKKMNPTILSEHNDDTENKDKKMEMKELEAKFAKLQEENESLKKKLADKDKNLSEEALKKREDKVAEQEKAIKLSEEKAEQVKKDSEKKGEFDTMLSEGKASEAQRDAFMKNDMAEFVKNAPKAGDLNLSEKGNSGKGNSGEFKDSDTPAQDEVISLSEKKVKEDKDLDISDAQSMVLSENPKLKEKYEKEVEV